MKYQIIIKPIDPANGRVFDRYVDVSGILTQSEVLGVVSTGANLTALRNTVTALAKGASTVNTVSIIAQLASNTVEPSTEQTVGLAGYLTAIEAAVDTSDVEDAIDGL